MCNDTAGVFIFMWRYLDCISDVSWISSQQLRWWCPPYTMDQSQLLVQPMNQWSVIFITSNPNRISDCTTLIFLLRSQSAVDTQ
ncbi:hypothetical protein VO69_06905 [Aeromonas salmonicida]|nr:hypothetical protein VO69_06905 [Aeromonas salmonicida]